jgi:hypothetical protein
VGGGWNHYHDHLRATDRRGQIGGNQLEPREPGYGTGQLEPTMLQKRRQPVRRAVEQAYLVTLERQATSYGLPATARTNYSKDTLAHSHSLPGSIGSVHPGA